MNGLGEVLQNALMITGFVFVMMVVIEYLNVLTRGNWDRVLARWTWGQTLFAAFLGMTPGCLGAYAVGSLYIHRVITFGALSAAMVATCGDEAFIMLAMFPQKAVLLLIVLFVVGVLSGILVDLLFKGRRTKQTEQLEHYQAVHETEARCVPFSRKELVAQWRRCAPHRGWLTMLLVMFIAGVISGKIGHHHLGVESIECAGHSHAAHLQWDWVRITLLGVGIIGFLIAATVPDHFLEEHLWNHIVRVHVARIFLWTLLAMVVVHFLVENLDVPALVSENRFWVLLLACLVGIIPASGPHLVFVSLFAEGAIPFSTLLASCVVQDGHGMIPLLAHSPRAFIAVKAVNFVIGMALGIVGLLLGW